MNDLGGGRQCESNDPDRKISSKLQNIKGARNAQAAKAELITYTGVQRVGHRRTPFVANLAEWRDGCVRIALAGGKEALIDASDYIPIGMFRWNFSKGTSGRGGYARTYFEGRAVPLQNVVMWLKGETAFDIADHRSGDPLDNRRENLRPASHTQNVRNSGPAAGRKYKGVFWDKNRQKWRAKIQNRHLGMFAFKETAARAYDAEAIVRFGEFARLNLPR